jgi:hypothetical protein
MLPKTCLHRYTVDGSDWIGELASRRQDCYQGRRTGSTQHTTFTAHRFPDIHLRTYLRATDQRLSPSPILQAEPTFRLARQNRRLNKRATMKHPKTHTKARSLTFSSSSSSSGMQ